MYSVKDNFMLPPNFEFSLFRNTGPQACMHYHDCLEILYVERGEASVVIEEKTYQAKRGDFFIFNNSERHMTIPGKDYSFLCMIFDIKFVWEHLDEYKYLKPFLSRGAKFSNQITSDDVFYGKLFDCIEVLTIEYGLKEPGWQLMVRTQVLQILVYLYRHYQSENELGSEEIRENKDYEKVRPVISYIHDHFQEPISLEDLARSGNMSRNYLSTFFKKVMGIKVTDYIEQVRISHSTVLLETTNLYITEIALQSGFGTVPYFNQIFKKVKGMTPSQFRKIGAQKSTMEIPVGSHVEET
ncbi:MAG: AraC family transcriptional regulator [Lachnospiraceae bacterium]